MIETGLRVGNLKDIISDVFKQDMEDIKIRRWIVQGAEKSYKEFWGEEYGSE